MASRHGVISTLGGAPPTPHVVAGFPGYVRTDSPTPVGREGDAIEDLDEAKAVVKAHSDLLKLVEIPHSKVKEAERIAAADIKAGRGALAEARRDGRASDDTSRFQDERKAVSKENR